MMEFLLQFPVVLQALMAAGFTWGVTALGASGIFLVKGFDRRIMDGMLGFAAGVMLAASFWSLLAPAVQMAESAGIPGWLPALTGFLMGGAFLRGVDGILPHLHIGLPRNEAEGLKTTWKGSTLLVLAVVLHNIPEGLAVGVAFGAAGSSASSAGLAAAVALTLGIGLQNFPEGLAVALPLRREGMSRARSFWYGQLSGMVEPAAAVIGALAVGAMTALLPYALSFAAGAMIFIVVEEVVPEAQRSGNTDLATFSAMLGFAAMMGLDVAFG